jgi:CoA:oxalate CoA-transferase
LPERALEGVKVIDLTHQIAGPYCTKLLADFGADVIKVERPGGDPARRLPPFFHDETDADKSLLFLYLNTNKRGITLNLKTIQGKAMLRDLIRGADMLVENYSPRVMPGLGLDYEALREINPSLVMTSISNFGQTGPYRDYRAADIVEYALGGLMYIFGGYDAPPLKHALHQAQFRAGTDSASASLMAMYHQRLTGQGQRVDVSIQECVASGLRDVVDNYTYSGAVRRREPNHRGDMTRIREVSDGYILPNPGITARLNWSVVADFLEAPELNDEKFNTASARLANAEALGEVMDRNFSNKKMYDMFYAAHKLRFIYGMVQSPEQVLADVQFAAREFFVDVDHPATGKVRYPGAPFRMEGTPWQVTRPAPTLGEHNQELLGEPFGYSDIDLSRLRAMEVI